MKKIWVFTAVTLLSISSPVFAQQNNTSGGGGESFGKGTNVISLGVGIGGVYTYWGSGYTETPNFVLSYENGTFGNVGPGTISLGGLVSYKAISYDYTNHFFYDQKWTYWIIGLRSAYHWNFTHSSKCDPYAGLMLGYYYLGYKLSSNDPNYNVPGDPYYYVYNTSYSSYWALSAYVGFRYYLSQNVGLWAELGYGYTTLALGVNFKL